MSEPEQVQEQAPEQEELPGMPVEDELLRAIDWLERKWGFHRECPYCSATAWYVGGPLRLAQGSMDAVVYGPEVFTATCRNCGHVTFINIAATDEMQAADRVEP